MYKFLRIIFIISILIFFAGCFKKFNSNGLTLKIEENELNTPIKSFPMKKNLVFANIKMEQPSIFVKKGTNFIASTVKIEIHTLFMPKTNALFTLSGNPYFQKENSSIYLKDIKIESLEFSNLQMEKEFSELINENLKPVLDEIFRVYPIYEIDKSSFKGSFVKDIKIENSEILVTFGI